jgi:hypothetical protein
VLQPPARVGGMAEVYKAYDINENKTVASWIDRK